MIIGKTRTIFCWYGAGVPSGPTPQRHPDVSVSDRPGTPPVQVVHAARDDVLERGRHIHDFPAIWYDQARATVYVAAAGEVVDPSQVGRSAGGVGVIFDPAALGVAGEASWPAWRSHPLLFPFVHGESGGLLELRLPAARQTSMGRRDRSD